MRLINSKGTKLVTILIPTRKRVQRLIENVRKIEANTTSPELVELIILVDRDDTETIDALQGFASPISTKIIIQERPPRAYQDIHLMYATMVEHSEGDLLFIFNDDAYIATPGWERLLIPYRYTPCVIHAGTAGESEFPIVHRQYPHSTGNFGRNCSIDRWFHMVAEKLDQNIYLSALEIIHARGNEPAEHIKDGYPPWNPLDVYNLRDEAQNDANCIRDDVNRPLVSFLIPSRKRPWGAQAAIESIYDTVAFPDRLEVLFRVDEDDQETIEWAQQVVGHYPNLQVFVGPRHPNGYQNLHLYYEELFRQSRGEFLFVFNDDAIMVNPGWDKVLLNWSGCPVILDPKWNHESEMITFPIISRKIPERMGVLCDHIYIDQWFHYVAVKSQRYVSARQPNNFIIVDHVREREPDNPRFARQCEPFEVTPLDVDRIAELVKRL